MCINNYIASLVAYMYMRTQFFYIELNLVAKAIYMLLCIAEQYLGTCPGTLCFWVSPVHG